MVCILCKPLYQPPSFEKRIERLTLQKVMVMMTMMMMMMMMMTMMIMMTTMMMMMICVDDDDDDDDYDDDDDNTDDDDTHLTLQQEAGSADAKGLGVRERIVKRAAKELKDGMFVTPSVTRGFGY